MFLREELAKLVDCFEFRLNYYNIEPDQITFSLDHAKCTVFCTINPQLLSNAIRLSHFTSFNNSPTPVSRHTVEALEQLRDYILEQVKKAIEDLPLFRLRFLTGDIIWTTHS